MKRQRLLSGYLIRELMSTLICYQYCRLQGLSLNIRLQFDGQLLK